MDTDIGESELNALRKAVRDEGTSIAAVARRAGVKARWLRTFIDGGIPDPGYRKVRKVQRAIDATASQG